MPAASCGSSSGSTGCDRGLGSAARKDDDVDPDADHQRRDSDDYAGQRHAVAPLSGALDLTPGDESQDHTYDRADATEDAEEAQDEGANRQGRLCRRSAACQATLREAGRSWAAGVGVGLSWVAPWRRGYGNGSAGKACETRCAPAVSDRFVCGSSGEQLGNCCCDTPWEIAPSAHCRRRTLAICGGFQAITNAGHDLDHRDSPMIHRPPMPRFEVCTRSSPIIP